MQKAQPLGVRGKPFGKNGVRSGRGGLDRAGRSSVPKKQRERIRLGRLAHGAGAARRGAEKDPALSPSRLDRGYCYDERQKGQSRNGRDRSDRREKRVRRNFGHRVQKLRSGAGTVSGKLPRFRVVRRRTAQGRLRRMRHARIRQAGRYFRHDDPAQRADVRL